MPRNSSIGLAAIACATLLAAPSSARAGGGGGGGGGGANLIVNGSFETPTVPVGSYINYGGGSTAITGWTVVGVDSSVISGSFTQSGVAFHAQQGVQFLDTAGTTSNSSSSGVSQNVPTAIGTTYTLRFYVGSCSDNHFFYPSTVDLRIAGGPRLSFTNPTAPTNQLNWMQVAVAFTATSATTNLTFLNGSASYNYESLIDNVTLEATSPPACGPADIGAQGGVEGSDGALDNNDFIVFISYFFASNTLADRGIQGGFPGSDGAFDNNDFIVFIDQFFTGC